MHVTGSNNIHVLDKDYKSIKVIKGVNSDCLDCEAIRKSRFSNEGDNFIWFRGGGVISLIDIGFDSENIQIFDIEVPMSK